MHSLVRAFRAQWWNVQLGGRSAKARDWIYIRIVGECVARLTAITVSTDSYLRRGMPMVNGLLAH